MVHKCDVVGLAVFVSNQLTFAVSLVQQSITFNCFLKMYFCWAVIKLNLFV